MSKTLVVCYSRSGHTKKLGQEIAKLINADFEEIFDTKDRKGILGFIKSGADAVKKKTTVLKPMKTNPADYDNVIIGSPVWASTLSTPVLTYIQTHASSLKKVAFFYTSGGSQTDEFLAQTNQYFGNPIYASMGASRKEVNTGEYSRKLKDFVSKLKA